MTHSSPYHPRGSGQCRRTNGAIWRAVQLTIKSRALDGTQWELVLDCVLHSITSHLCTYINQTPHDGQPSFPRKFPTSNSLPTWLFSHGHVYLCKFASHSEYDPLVESVNPIAAIHFPCGKESTVFTYDLLQTTLNNPRTWLPSPNTKTLPAIFFPLWILLFLLIIELLTLLIRPAWTHPYTIALCHLPLHLQMFCNIL